MGNAARVFLSFSFRGGGTETKFIAMSHKERIGLRNCILSRISSAISEIDVPGSTNGRPALPFSTLLPPIRRKICRFRILLSQVHTGPNRGSTTFSDYSRAQDNVAPQSRCNGYLRFFCSVDGTERIKIHVISLALDNSLVR